MNPCGRICGRICFFFSNIIISLLLLFSLSSFSPAHAAGFGTVTSLVSIGVCGNNIVERGEDCDGSALDGQTCQSLGYDAGTLTCGIGCDFNVFECVNLGPDEGSVVLSGKAYPNSVVKILKDGQIAATTAADSNGDFKTTLSHLIVGSYSFAVYTYDSNDNKSKTTTYTKEISKDEIKEIAGIIVPPTLRTDTDKAQKGDKIALSGQSAPLAKITIYLFSGSSSWSLSAIAGSNGYYFFELDTNDYAAGSYTVSAKTTIDSLTSEASDAGSFEINDVINDNAGDDTTVADDGTDDSANSSNDDSSVETSESSETASSSAKGWRKVDFNEDSRVNLIDFSILIHWFDKSDFPPKVDANTDKKVNLSDFSVMMYYWSG